MNDIIKLQEIKPLLSGDDCCWQQILDVGFTRWQDKSDTSVTSYSTMADFMLEEFGHLAKLALLLGKYNQQVCNGGHTQYLDNGYASRERNGWNQKDIDLHNDLIRLVRNHLDIELKNELLSVLTDFRVSFDSDCPDCGGMGEIETDEENEECCTCNGFGEVEGAHVVGGDALDDRYYAINEKVEKQVTKFFDSLLTDHSISI